MTQAGGFRRSFGNDPTLMPRLFDLIDTSFPWLRQAVTSGPGLGPSWEEQSTPFIRFDADLAVTHLGLMEMPFVLMGREVTAGAIHGARRVCPRRAAVYDPAFGALLRSPGARMI